MNNDDTVLLTRENLHALSTSNDGFTRAQIELLGYTWPPRKGWLSALIGRRIPKATYDQAKDCAKVKAKQWRKECNQMMLL